MSSLAPSMSRLALITNLLSLMPYHMMKLKNIFRGSVCSIAALTCACGHLGMSGGDEPSKKVASTAVPREESRQPTPAAGMTTAPSSNHAAVKPTPSEVKLARKEAVGDLELKMTRLWARVDELEQNVSLQEQRIFLLQKGLMTGVVPDELLQMDGRPAPRVFAPSAENKGENKAKKPKEAPVSASLAGGSVEPSPPAVSPKANLNTEQQKEYQKKLVEAQVAFDAQQYGNAIALYEKLGAEYADGVTGGSQLYWVGLCWFYLKSYDAAQRYFARFIEGYKTNPLIPRAKFHLAKTEYSAGFTEKSIGDLNKIIKEYPSDEISETARWEIKKIEEKL